MTINIVMELTFIDYLLMEDTSTRREGPTDGDGTHYHREIGFPNKLLFPKTFRPRMKLSYGTHARYEAMSDRYGKLALPEFVDLNAPGVTAFEIAVKGGTVNKVAVRMPFNNELDICVVFYAANGFVKTVWANKKTDTHKTLNKKIYADPAKRA